MSAPCFMGTAARDTVPSRKSFWISWNPAAPGRISSCLADHSAMAGPSGEKRAAWSRASQRPVRVRTRPSAHCMTAINSTFLEHYDPGKGLKTIAVAESAENYFRRAKDTTKLLEAVER